MQQIVEALANLIFVTSRPLEVIHAWTYPASPIIEPLYWHTRTYIMTISNICGTMSTWLVLFPMLRFDYKSRTLALTKPWKHFMLPIFYCSNYLVLKKQQKTGERQWDVKYHTVLASPRNVIEPKYNILIRHADRARWNENQRSLDWIF